MFNAANALFNAGTFGSAMPKTPIRLGALCVCQATYTARLAGGARNVSARAVLTASTVARVRALRRVTAVGIGELTWVTRAHCLHPSRLEVRAVLEGRAVAKAHRAASVTVSGVAQAACTAKVHSKQRMKVQCVGRFVSVVIVGSSNADRVPDSRKFSLSVHANNFALGEGAMSLIGVINKQPVDRFDHDVDCSGLVGDYDVVQTATATVSPSGLTVDAPTVFSDRVKLWVGGGADGVTYKVTLTVYSRDGRVQQDEIRVKVKEV